MGAFRLGGQLHILVWQQDSEPQQYGVHHRNGEDQDA